MLGLKIINECLKTFFHVSKKIFLLNIKKFELRYDNGGIFRFCGAFGNLKKFFCRRVTKIFLDFFLKHKKILFKKLLERKDF